MNERGSYRVSTVIFASVSMCLAVGTGLTIWQLRETSAEPMVQGTHIALGLPLTDQNQNRKFEAKSAVLWHQGTGAIQFEQNAFERMPIASITKLMTAMVALDYGFDPEKVVDILPNEYVQGGRLLLHAGEHVTMRDLFNASLLGSANNATLAYVRALEVDEQEFVRAMNRKAVELELEQTTFVDVTGLDPDNVSTAYEVARLAAAAFAQYPEIAAATRGSEYTFTMHGSGRTHTIRNTNKLISDEGLVAQGSKTGYLYEAGYCLVTMQGERVAVVLGSQSEPQHFQDIKRLLLYE